MSEVQKQRKSRVCGSKTKVVGAHVLCCGDGALLREGAVGARQQLEVKANI
jgi:hypothetical protein